MKALTLLFLSFCLLSVQAQREYDIEQYGTAKGLSHDEVNSLFRDSRGFIWIGTNFGLNVFDGIRFTNYYQIPGKTNSLPNNNVFQIAEDQQHHLWIGTQKGVSRFDPSTQEFRNYFTKNADEKKPDINHCHVFVSKNNTVWIGHDKGVIELNPITGKFKTYELQLSPTGKFRNQFVNNFAEDKNGTLWVATSYGVYSRKLKDTSFTSYKFPEAYPDEAFLNACTKIVVDNKGNVIYGTWNGGIVFKAFDKNYFQPAHKKGETGYDISVFDILPDTDSTIWLSTAEGLLHTENEFLTGGKNYNLQKGLSVKSDPRGLMSKPSFSLLKDAKERLWISTEYGFIKMTPKKSFAHEFNFSVVNDWAPLRILESRDKRSLFIMNGKSLIHYKDSTHSFKANELSLMGKFPQDISRGKTGYWMTANPGFYHLDENLKPIDIISLSNSGKQEYFTAICEDQEGLIWLGDARRNGIKTYNPVTKELKHYLDSDTSAVDISGSDTRQIIEDAKGDIWIATLPLVHYIRKKNSFEPIRVDSTLYNTDEANNILSLCIDRKGVLWVGTLAGLYYFEEAKNKLLPVTLPEYISPQIQRITADKDNTLWLNTQSGIVIYDQQKKTFNILDKKSGLPMEVASNDLITRENGEVVTGYDGGIMIVQPSLLEFNQSFPSPEWTSIIIDNDPVSSKWKGKTPELAYNQSIAFSFISPSYDNPEKHHYAAQLMGIDKDWRDLGNNTSQRFSNLPAGTYEFRVKVATADGTWNEKYLSYSFIVNPPFWKTWWFLILCALIILTAVWGLYRYRLQSALRMEKLRTRIATDLHDDIGATLSSITMYSESIRGTVKEQLPQLEPILNKIGDTSRNMISSMSDIVWAINPANDAGEKLVQRMESYARDICAVKQVSLQFEADEKLKDLNLPLELRKNIYLIFKEALNNALKYAEATQINIQITGKQNQLHLHVSDNGKGFEENLEGKGNGLKNMEMRAKEIHALLKISSDTNKGTMVELHCPL